MIILTTKQPGDHDTQEHVEYLEREQVGQRCLVMSDREALFKETLAIYSDQMALKAGVATGKIAVEDAENVLSAALAYAISRT
jgi:hypothetical protein